MKDVANKDVKGTTRILLIRVPFFRDVIVESFECPHCHFQNNSVKPAGPIQEKGARYILIVENDGDLQRQVVKNETAIFTVESLGIEMPKGESQLSNVEGVLQKVQQSLSYEQPLRKIQTPELYNALQPIIEKLEAMLEGKSYPFTISLDDPTGNSWIAPNPDDKGNKYRRHNYPRTHEQNEELGLTAGPATGPRAATMTEKGGDDDDDDIVNGKVYTLPAECPGCAKPCTVNMQKVDGPNFKEVFIWSTVCDACGYRTNEVKTGGEVPDKGRRITLKVEGETDLCRDILKSDTCALISEDLEVTVEPGTLGGRFTTIEGLLTEIRDQLRGQIYDIDDKNNSGGDSMPASDKEKWNRFFSRLNSAISGDMKFTITLQDPLANSFVQDLCSPARDPQLTIEDYTRTDEEEDELGLKDMKVEGYEEDESKQEDSEKTG